MDDPLIWGWVLIAVAGVLLFAEFFIPTGGALALTSAAAGVAGVVLLWQESRTWGLLGILCILVLGPAMLAYGVRVWPNTPIGRRIIGAPSDEEAAAKAKAEADARISAQSMIGREGVALTELRPVGTVEIDGKRHDAMSETHYVPAGTRVRVTGIDVVQLKVRPVA